MMDEHFSDEDIRELRAADPAAGVEASAQLRDRVAAISSEGAAARKRSGWRLLAPIAAAGVIVAAIGGGYIWGTGGIHFAPASTPLAVETGTPGSPAAPIDLGGGSADVVGGALTEEGALQ